MVRSVNTFALMKRRLKHHARIRRSDPFRRVDSEELEVACRRIAGNTEFGMWSVRDEGRDGDCRVIGFETADRAAAMQAWIDESKIAERPMPKLGPSKEELTALREASLRWGFATGATRRVVQAYRRKMLEDGEGSAAQCAAAETVQLHRPPGDEPLSVAMFLVEWAKENHREWFYRRRVRVDEGKEKG